MLSGEVGSHFTSKALRDILGDWTQGKIDGDKADDVVDEALVVDGDWDMLTGSSGYDWFIISAGDKITDFKVKNPGGDLVTVV